MNDPDSLLKSRYGDLHEQLESQTFVVCLHLVLEVNCEFMEVQASLAELQKESEIRHAGTSYTECR